MAEEVVDILDDSPPPQPKVQPPSADQLREAVAGYLNGKELKGLSVKVLRRGVEQHLGLSEGSLDGRRDEVKALAQDAMAARARPAAPEPVGVESAQVARVSSPAPTPRPVAPQAASAGVQEPATKRRRGLFGAGRPNTAQPQPAPVPPQAAAPLVPPQPPAAAQAAQSETGVQGGPAGAEAEPPRKRKRPCASAYSLWVADNRASVVAELTTEGQKPRMPAVGKALSERWKALSQEERSEYEARAATAKKEAKEAAKTTEQAPTEPAEKKRRGGRGGRGGRGAQEGEGGEKPGRGGGRGRGRGRGQSRRTKEVDTIPSHGLTRAEFLRAALTLQCSISSRENDTQAPKSSSPILPGVSLTPRLFKTGTAGWFCMPKISMNVAGKEVPIQVQVSLTAIGSKGWLDGEGLEEASAAAEARATEVKKAAVAEAVEASAQPQVTAPATAAATVATSALATAQVSSTADVVVAASQPPPAAPHAAAETQAAGAPAPAPEQTATAAVVEEDPPAETVQVTPALAQPPPVASDAVLQEQPAAAAPLEEPVGQEEVCDGTQPVNEVVLQVENKAQAAEEVGKPACEPLQSEEVSAPKTESLSERGVQEEAEVSEPPAEGLPENEVPQGEEVDKVDEKRPAASPEGEVSAEVSGAAMSGGA